MRGISNRVGQAKIGYTVCIQRADMTYVARCETKWVGTNLAKRADEISTTTPGKGSVTAIKYNPNMIINTPDGNRHSCVGVAHELIHAYFNLKGKGLGSGKLRNVNGLVDW